MKTSRPLLVLRPDCPIDTLVAALSRTRVSRRFSGRVVVEAEATGSPVLERKLDSWNCHDQRVASAHRTAQQLRERLLEYSRSIDCEVRTRLTADEVAQVARDHQADTVLISRTLPKSRLAGLVAPFEARVCRLAPCPVWCAGVRPLSSRVAVAVDPNATTEEVRMLNVQLLRQAAALARSAGREPELHLIGAWDLFGLTPDWWRRSDPATTELIRRSSEAARKELAALASTIRRTDLAMHIHAVEGAAPVAISKVLGEVDPSLLVIGNNQRTGVRHAFHVNTVESVLKQATCSVFSVVTSESEQWNVTPTDVRQTGDRAEQSNVNAVA